MDVMVWLGLSLYLGMGVVATTLSLRRFFDRLERVYPDQPRHSIGLEEILLYTVTVPLWPAVLGASEILSRFIAEPVGTRRPSVSYHYVIDLDGNIWPVDASKPVPNNFAIMHYEKGP